MNPFDPVAFAEHLNRDESFRRIYESQPLEILRKAGFQPKEEHASIITSIYRDYIRSAYTFGGGSPRFQRSPLQKGSATFITRSLL